jgi:DNA-binding transcriptional regulator YdaS (Cro superfamily)
MTEDVIVVPKAKHLLKPYKTNWIAGKLGVLPATVRFWGEVPIKHVIKLEEATGIPREKIRPDYYPPKKGAENGS